jgi:hypothetical protein
LDGLNGDEDQSLSYKLCSLRVGSLSYKFLNLFNIVHKKYATIAEVVNTIPLNNLIASMTNVNLQAEKDTIIWNLSKSVSFIVRLMYKYLITNDIMVIHEIWRVKVPLKIRIFL